jgi:DNA-binding CsgD family transcriptional regulator
MRKPLQGRPLTESERALLSLLIEGKRPKQIAGALNITLGAIAAHLYRVRHKLDAKTTVQAVALYLKSQQ